MRLVNLTFGGTFGYCGPHVILNSNNLPSKCVCEDDKNHLVTIRFKESEQFLFLEIISITLRLHNSIIIKVIL